MKKLYLLFLSLTISFSLSFAQVKEKERCDLWFSEHPLQNAQEFLEEKEKLGIIGFQHSNNLSCFKYLEQSIQKEILAEIATQRYPNQLFREPIKNPNSDPDYHQIHHDLALLASLCPNNKEKERSSQLHQIFIAQMPILYPRIYFPELPYKIKHPITQCINSFKGGDGDLKIPELIVTHHDIDKNFDRYSTYYADFEFTISKDPYLALIELIYEKIYIMLYQADLLTVDMEFPYPKSLLRKHLQSIDPEFYQLLATKTRHAEHVINYFKDEESWLNSLNQFIYQLSLEDSASQKK